MALRQPSVFRVRLHVIPKQHLLKSWKNWGLDDLLLTHRLFLLLWRVIMWKKEQPKEAKEIIRDRKSTRLNSSHVRISYAVFCLKKKKKKNNRKKNNNNN